MWNGTAETLKPNPIANKAPPISQEGIDTGRTEGNTCDARDVESTGRAVDEGNTENGESGRKGAQQEILDSGLS